MFDLLIDVIMFVAIMALGLWGIIVGIMLLSFISMLAYSVYEAIKFITGRAIRFVKNNKPRK